MPTSVLAISLSANPTDTCRRTVISVSSAAAAEYDAADRAGGQVRCQYRLAESCSGSSIQAFAGGISLPVPTRRKEIGSDSADVRKILTCIKIVDSSPSETHAPRPDASAPEKRVSLFETVCESEDQP